MTDDISLVPLPSDYSKPINERELSVIKRYFLNLSHLRRFARANREKLKMALREHMRLKLQGADEDIERFTRDFTLLYSIADR